MPMQVSRLRAFPLGHIPGVAEDNIRSMCSFNRTTVGADHR
jgi:hypothetical protein